MKMTTDEIIKRINDSIENVSRLNTNIIGGKIYADTSSAYKDVRFELRNIEPKNNGEFLDWFIVTKEQAAEVITKFIGEDDTQKELICINDFILENGLSEDKIIYLAPYLPSS